MTKWADYVITKVRFNAAGTHINELVVQDDLDAKLGPSRIEQRATVIANIKARKSYITAPPSATGVSKGALVGIVVVNGAEYLRTDANKTARDNLDNLPTF
jgi:hypothetical protein